jgi:hypothetical protein
LLIHPEGEDDTSHLPPSEDSQAQPGVASLEAPAGAAAPEMLQPDLSGLNASAVTPAAEQEARPVAA